MKNDYTTREGQLMPDAARRTTQFCGNVTERIADIPLRIKKELAPFALADAEFKQVPTEDLMALARRKHVYVTDRASAIAVLKGIVKA